MGRRVNAEDTSTRRDSLRFIGDVHYPSRGDRFYSADRVGRWFPPRADLFTRPRLGRLCSGGHHDGPPVYDHREAASTLREKDTFCLESCCTTLAARFTAPVVPVRKSRWASRQQSLLVRNDRAAGLYPAPCRVSYDFTVETHWALLYAALGWIVDF